MEKVQAGRRSSWEPYWEDLSGNQVIFRAQAAHYVRNLESALTIGSQTKVLDFGCGFGFVAEMLAPRVGEIFLWDPAANMRCRSRFNVGGQQNVRFIDPPETNVSTPVQFDLILVNSVVQYMTLEGFSAWLVRWRRMLTPSGRLVVSDIIPANHMPITDLLDLLKFAAQRGVLMQTIWRSMNVQSRYRRTRKACPLLRFEIGELSRLGDAAGLTVTYLPTNLTHLSTRMTAVFSAA